MVPVFVSGVILTLSFVFLLLAFANYNAYHAAKTDLECQWRAGLKVIFVVIELFAAAINYVFAFSAFFLVILATIGYISPRWLKIFLGRIDLINPPLVLVMVIMLIGGLVLSLIVAEHHHKKLKTQTND